MERVEVIWGHVPTEDNPTHRASRDKLVSKEIVRACIKTSKWEIYFHNLLGVNWPMQTGRKSVRNGKQTQQNFPAGHIIKVVAAVMDKAPV